MKQIKMIFFSKRELLILYDALKMKEVSIDNPIRKAKITFLKEKVIAKIK